MGWREVKEAGRRQVHAAFSYAAEYTAPGSATPTFCNVRIHERDPVDAGRMDGGYAGFSELPVQALSDPEEVTPERLGVFKLEDDRQYRVERLLPHDGQFQRCEVVRL